MLIGISYSFLVTMFVQIFYPFLTGLTVFLLLQYKGSFKYSRHKSFKREIFSSIFSQSVACLFCFLTNAFWRANLIVFVLLWFICLCLLKKLLPNPGHKFFLLEVYSFHFFSLTNCIYFRIPF